MMATAAINRRAPKIAYFLPPWRERAKTRTTDYWFTPMAVTRSTGVTTETESKGAYMNTLVKLALATSCLIAMPFGVQAASSHDSNHGGMQMASADAAAQMSDGEVRKIDKDAKKITIKHGDLKNLGMPPMTMVFQVKDPAMLEQVKAGDKISFVADKIGGQLTVTKLEVKK
jgi:Cu(I)/Ag(I) efflux system periplasmic protein CusF